MCAGHSVLYPYEAKGAKAETKAKAAGLRFTPFRVKRRGATRRRYHNSNAHGIH
jgi:hypothetical protein